MKVEVKKEVKRFEPFEMAVKITSVDELLALWHVTNQEAQTFRDLRETGGTCKVSVPVSEKLYTLWKVLDDELEKLGLK